MERKVATVLFVDLVDSTGLVASADPEVVRRRVNRYFDGRRSCIEVHGGTVEKFAGDAVMAAFGVPLTHEDDAERAVRAALAILPTASTSSELSVRIGVESGEVVVDEGDSTFATGEAVNLAARLQQAAQPGEILLGPTVRRLAAGTVEVDDAGRSRSRVAGSRSGPGGSFAPTTRAAASPRRSSGARRSSSCSRTPSPGRSATGGHARHHLRRARNREDAARHASSSTGVERVTTLAGRSLPYGEGVTYWPLASMIKASAGITDDEPATEAFDKLRACCESEAVADLLAVALGVLGAAEGERTRRAN